MSRNPRDCASFAPLLAAFADHALEGAEDEQVRHHVTACPACAGEVQALAAVLASARAQAPRPEKSDAFWQDFARGVRVACAEEPPSLGARLGAWLRRPLVLGGLAVAVAGAVALALALRPGAPSEVARPQVVPASSAPGEVEPAVPPAPKDKTVVAGHEPALLGPHLSSIDVSVNDLDAQQLGAVLRALEDDDETTTNMTDEEAVALAGPVATVEVIESLDDEELALVSQAL